MHQTTPHGNCRQKFFVACPAPLVAFVVLAWLMSFSGCSAFRPMKGVPARYVPNEVRAKTRSGKETINLAMLRQTPPKEYLLDSGDVLGVYIEGILGTREEAPPVYFPDEDTNAPPSLGYPIPVREDGTVSLPMIAPMNVRGMTVREFEDRVRNAYTIDRKVLKAGSDRILVSLQKPRTYQVLVIRQEAGGDPGVTVGQGGVLNLGANKHGSGEVVTLQAYKNDVLHALAETGGLPGLDAENTIYIIRQNRIIPAAHIQPVPVIQPQPHVIPQPQYRVQPAPQVQPKRTIPPQSQPRVKPQHQPTPVPENRQPLPDVPHIPPGPALPEMSTGIQQTSHTVEHSTGFGHSIPQYSSPPVRQANVTPTQYNTPHGNYRNSMIPPVMPPAMSQPTLPGSGSVGPSMPHFPAIAPVVNGLVPGGATINGHNVVKIPVRLYPGEVPQITEQDIILQDGDIVFIESRETEIFYTGGLLGGGQFTLPRDYDLDVLGAISIAQGRGGSGGDVRSAGGVSSLNNDISVSASNVIILRQLENGTQVPIKVDLYKALRNPAERVKIRPGDYVMLQYTKTEAVSAWFERYIIEGLVAGAVLSQVDDD